MGETSMSEKTLIDRLILPPVSIDAGKEAVASLREKYKSIIEENNLNSEECFRENLDHVHSRIAAMRQNAEEQIYKTYQTRTDSCSSRLSRLLNELSAWLSFGTYFEYLYSDTANVKELKPIEDLGPDVLKVLEDNCGIPDCKLLFTVGHIKFHNIIIQGDPYSVLVNFAAIIVSYIILKKKQAVTQDSIKEIMDNIIYKSSVFAENDPAVLFYETGYFDPEEEIRDYLKAKHLGLDQEKYKFAYANAVKWNKRFQYIQSQILHLNNQKLDTIRIFSQMTPDTPFTSVASVQENIVISLGGRDDMLLSRLAMIAWLMRDSIVYNGERRRYTFDDMERLVKIQADNYIRYGMFISNEIYRK